MYINVAAMIPANQLAQFGYFLLLFGLKMPCFLLFEKKVEPRSLFFGKPFRLGSSFSLEGFFSSVGWPCFDGFSC
jgi:hypothetical protein